MSDLVGNTKDWLSRFMAHFIKLLFRQITKACPYNIYPFEPHFYIAKRGYTGVYLFLFLLQNIDCGYSLETPQRGGSNMYP